MITALTSWWRARTPREQRLLLVMFALLAAVLVWLLVLRPLADALETAKQRHGAAVIALAEARAREDTARRLQGSSARPPLPVELLITRTASEAGFTDARIVSQGPAQATIAIDAARPQAVFGWLAQLEAAGLVVQSLQARAQGDRTLAVEAILRARG